LSHKPAPAADGQLQLTVVDEETKRPVACRMHLVGKNRKPRKVETAPFWHDHFVFPGKITLKLPLGDYQFEIRRGLEYHSQQGHFVIERFADDTKQLELRRAVDMSAEGWWSGDLYVRRPQRDIELLMSADDLHLAQVVTWSNDKNEWGNKPRPKSEPVLYDRNRWYYGLAGLYSRAGTDLLCFFQPEPLPLTQSPGEYPPTIQTILAAKEKGKLWVDVAAPYSWDLPMLVAHDLVDSIQVAHSHFCRQNVVADEAGGKPRDLNAYSHVSGYARWIQDIYFRLLDCGVRIPPSAGSGSGVAANPVGYNRVYVHLEGSLQPEAWWKHFRGGQVVVTNGPLLRPRVEGHLPGYVFRTDEGEELELEIGLTLSTCDPISYLEVIQDGRVAYTLRFEDYAKTGRLPKVKCTKSGWFLLRAVNDLNNTYRFAMTAPWYVEFGGKRRISKQAAQFFLDWVYERARQIKIDDAGQRREVLQYHRKARDYWQALVGKANAE
jgi:hypothetical protein